MVEEVVDGVEQRNIFAFRCFLKLTYTYTNVCIAQSVLVRFSGSTSSTILDLGQNHEFFFVNTKVAQNMSDLLKCLLPDGTGLIVIWINPKLNLKFDQP